MYKVGITGGIGSGKSTVAKIFEVLGIPVYYADDAARQLMETNLQIKEQLINTFGANCYSEKGLNRQYLRELIFSDTNNTKKINSIVHPVTIADADAWLAKQTTPYALKEAALIFESDAHLRLDAIIGVHAPKQLRIARVIQRDKITEVEVIARMDKQMDEDKKMSLCHYVIKNNEEELLITQVLKLHQTLLAKATL
jgi:dephospho-CoA kinase